MADEDPITPARALTPAEPPPDRAGPRVAVLGASGFAGALAAALLRRHPYFRLGAITARAEAGQTQQDQYPHHRVGDVHVEPDLDANAADHHVANVGYPHGASS
ncbi:MAG: hypothetical protein AB7G37_18035, partial [Solirubrobacteraceae bacterium]